MTHIMILQHIVSFEWPSLEQFVVSPIVLAKSFNALYCSGKSTTGSVVCELRVYDSHSNIGSFYSKFLTD